MFKLSVAFAFVAVVFFQGVVCTPLPLEGGFDLIARVPQVQTLPGLKDSIVGEVGGLVPAITGETLPEVGGFTGELGL